MINNSQHPKFYKMYRSDSKNYFLNHLKSLRNASAFYQADITMDCKTLQVNVHFPTNDSLLYPQFLKITSEGPVYTGQFSDEAVCFIGWRPYHVQRVNAFSDKLNFKDKLSNHGFLTPEYSVDRKYNQKDVIVKSRQGSFGKSIYGPYKNSSEYPLNSEAGEYFEKFIPGKILKISYWNTEPVFIEKQAMPTLTGNGKSTILELALSRAKARGRKINEFQLDETVSYQGKTTETILAPGEKILADFRYESDLSKCYAVKEIPLPHKAFTRFEAEFKRLGEFLFSLVLQEDIERLFFSVDALLSTDNKLWIIEANSNPAVPPSAYPMVLKTLHHSKS